MSAIQHIPLWQFIISIVVMWSFGFLSGAALFYPIGRRHGIDALAEHMKKWRGGTNEDPIEKLAASVGARVRGDIAAKNKSDQRNA
jgi:hypothetical protein